MRYRIQDAASLVLLCLAIVASFALAIPAGALLAIGVPDKANPFGMAIGRMLSLASGLGVK